MVTVKNRDGAVAGRRPRRRGVRSGHPARRARRTRDPPEQLPCGLSLVPAYAQCTAPNRTHGPPLAFGSCSPAIPSSSFVTVGTNDANGAPANSTGSIRMDVLVGVPGPPDDSEVIITPTISDVRCKGTTTACGNANAAGGPDYTGQLEGNAMVRVTDHFNAVNAGGGSDPATLVDIPFPISMSCVNTADTSVGGLCKTPTTTCVGCPPPNWEGHRVVAEITQIQVFDGGPDGIPATADGNTLFAVQGLFVP